MARTYLTVVASKVHVVQRVVRRRVDVLFQQVPRDHVSVVNLPARKQNKKSVSRRQQQQAPRRTHDDGPQVDDDEQPEVDPFMHGEDKDDEVVRYRLGVSVQGVESERGERSRYYSGQREAGISARAPEQI